MMGRAGVMSYRIHAVWLLLLGFLVPVSAQAADIQPDIRPGDGVSSQRALSDYFAPLQGTNLDTTVYVLESGEPGATALIIGGTHGNEFAGMMAAQLLVENAVVRQGRLIVVPFANRSALSVKDTRMGIEPVHKVQGRTGERVLLYGDRRTDIADQGVEDPESYENPGGYVLDNGMESRNLNRTWPGLADGTPTEQLSHALIQLIREEGVDFSLDMHEADTPERKEFEAGDYSPGGNKRLAYTLVAHPRGLETAAFALLEMEADTGISMKLEESNPNYRGLSHLEIADNKDSLSFLSESPNPGQDRWRNDADVVTDPKYPLTHRAGMHLRLVRHLADAYGDESGRKLVIDRLPEYEELVSGGIGRYLN